MNIEYDEFEIQDIIKQIKNQQEINFVNIKEQIKVADLEAVLIV